MASKRRIVDMPPTRVTPVLEKQIATVSKGWAICYDCIVWLYDKAKVTAKGCTIIRVNCPDAVITGSDNRVVNFDNIPRDLYDHLVAEGALNAV